MPPTGYWVDDAGSRPAPERPAGKYALHGYGPARFLQLRRWLPRRPLVLVADSSYAVLDLLHFCQFMASPVTFITRLRLEHRLLVGGCVECHPERSEGSKVPGTMVLTLLAMV